MERRASVHQVKNLTAFGRSSSLYRRTSIQFPDRSEALLYHEWVYHTLLGR